ncbi:hypothetical protein [Geobacter benzoatilyticus]|uniref:Uncharacterized protein n=1 Tax=Geobacter benzoatilyticus TaxID=2815309 RepID=A0ABX7Q5P0_9BACT|nr:hypothetical protein [Geobacter benzoatilyticus]QSV46320.1 hypothetical protein JZM60_03305 [Geobacter benzoatilyticus]
MLSKRCFAVTATALGRFGKLLLPNPASSVQADGGASTLTPPPQQQTWKAIRGDPFQQPTTDRTRLAELLL